MKNLKPVNIISRREFIKILSCSCLLVSAPIAVTHAAGNLKPIILMLNSGNKLQLNSGDELLLQS